MAGIAESQLVMSLLGLSLENQQTTPSLMGLPLETLGCTFRILGPEFFKEDLGRLTISKKWYLVAQEELQSTVPMGGNDLLRFRFEPDAPIWAKGRVHTVKLALRHTICDISLMHPTGDAGPSDRAVDEHLYQRSLFGLFHYTTECQAMHSVHTQEVTQAFQLLQQAQGVRKIELAIDITEARTQRRADWIDPPCGRAGYLIVRQLSDLNLPALRELDLNMPMVGAFYGVSHDDIQDHVCAAINRLLNGLPGLNAAHLRLFYICPRIFARAPAKPMNLETLHLHLDVGDDQFFGPSCRCGAANYLGGHAVKTDHLWINILAASLAPAIRGFSRSVRAPKIFRIIWPDMRSDARLAVDPSNREEKRMFAWDSVDNQLRAIPRTGNWSDDGQVIDLDGELDRGTKRFNGLQFLLDEVVGVEY